MKLYYHLYAKGDSSEISWPSAGLWLTRRNRNDGEVLQILCSCPSMSSFGPRWIRSGPLAFGGNPSLKSMRDPPISIQR